MNQLLYMDDLKLLGRSEDDLENKIKIAKAVHAFFSVISRGLNFICQFSGALSVPS